jgi:hypothetical protein
LVFAICPHADDILCLVEALIAKDVGVSVFHLLDDAFEGLWEGEELGFFADLAEKDQEEKKIAEFFLKVLGCLFDFMGSVQGFECFFAKERKHTRQILCAIPRTALRTTQDLYEGDELGESIKTREEIPRAKGQAQAETEPQT